MSLPKLTGPLVLATHSGTFHCDEVVATAFLKFLCPDLKLVRSRDPEVIKNADIVVDVGAEFDVLRLRFDHHQREFTDCFGEEFKNITKMSSAGLIYKFFGRQVLSEKFNVEPLFLEKAYRKIYKNFILSIDAIDNGVDIADERRYSINSDLGSRISKLNPAWNEPTSEEIENSQFNKAVEIATEEILSQINGVVKSWLPARSLVETAIQNRFDFHPSGKVIQLSQFCPWIEHLQDIEDENEELKSHEILYCVFKDQTNTFRVRAVPVERGSFNNRKSIPEPLCGLRDQALEKAAGINGLIFVHASGFIAGTKTEEAAKSLVDYSLNFYQI
jgi:uncharacterized UPF0160 family protein